MSKPLKTVGTSAFSHKGPEKLIAANICLRKIVGSVLFTKVYTFQT